MRSPRAVLGVGLLSGLLAAPAAHASEPGLLSSEGCCIEAHDAGDVLVGALAELLIRGFFELVSHTGTHREESVDGELEPGKVAGRKHAAPLSFRLGGEGLMLRDASPGGDFFIGLDVQQFGVSAHLATLGLESEDGSDADDGVVLETFHLSWALLVLEQARLRAEAGISAAQTSDVTFIGPSLGLSFEGCLGGPLDVEGRVQVTPAPYRQVDTTAGLALHMGGFVMRGGVRGLYLDDAGRLGGLAKRDMLFGPYLGAGFVF